MPELDPRDLIDRHAEQEEFRRIVPGAESTETGQGRMLTICDRGGRGKSSLLKRLLYNCQFDMKPQASGCLVELDRLAANPSPFALVKSIHKGLTKVTGVEMQKRFAKFNRLNGARELRDFTLFEESGDGPSGVRVSAMAAIGTVSEGSRAAGVNLENVQNAQITQITQRAEFTEEQELRAQQRCVEAFFDDLRVVCATQSVVVMFDTWERCNLQLRDWIRDEFLANHALHPDPGLRPDRLVVVVAGRPYDPPDTRYGLRPDEFRPLFDSEEELEATVRSVKSLSEWEAEHVSKFLVLNGCPAPDDDDIRFIQSKLQLGWSLEKILTFIDDYLRPQS
ncbi:hypothetical protein [Geodermatophilus sp. URMC 63]